MVQFAEGRHDWALLGYLKASEAGYELAQANAAWMLSHDFGIPPEQSARSYVEAGKSSPRHSSNTLLPHFPACPLAGEVEKPARILSYISHASPFACG